ncbi:MAG: ABC transporter permease [Thermoleophilia bacterium]|nr:ABC transporter permease [Thermoleophilia bacterium]
MSWKTLLGGAAVLAVVAYAVIAPLVSPWDPNDVDFDLRSQLPSLTHPLGTDMFGRDLATRIAVGGRTTLLIAGSALGIILVVGFLWGTTAALAGRGVDSLMMRIVDGLLALPRLPIAIVVLVALRLSAATVWGIVLALSVAGWMLTARLVRGHVLALKSRDYVTAARAIGSSWPRITRRHILPNSTGILLVAVLLELPVVVLGEAFLSILGLGPPAPAATWGNIAYDGWSSFRVWEMLVATLAITVFAVSASLFADGLADVLDPRRRGRRA